MSTVFISYRRGDSAGHTGRLLDSLEERFGRQAFFRDLESLEYGSDFPAELSKALASCRVVLVMIGPGWLSAQAGGLRRLDQPEDLVRQEVATALARKDVRTIPVLVGGATMPSGHELPEPLKPLATRNSIEISDSRWDYDLGRLASTLVKAAGLTDREAGAAREGSGAPASDVPVATGKRASSLAKQVLITLGAVAVALVVFSIAIVGLDDGAASAAHDAGLGTFEHDWLTWTTDTGDRALDWNEAVVHCASVRMRLPTIEELETIADPNDPSALGLKLLRPFHDKVGSNWIWSSEADGAGARLAFDFKTLERTPLAADFNEGAHALCVTE